MTTAISSHKGGLNAIASTNNLNESFRFQLITAFKFPTAYPDALLCMANAIRYAFGYGLNTVKNPLC